MSIGFETLRLEAAERAMAAYRARKAREAREGAARPSVSQRGPVPGHGTRRISREEALQIIAKKSPHAALRLLSGYLAGRPTRRDK